MASNSLINTISQAENTPELRKYWERRFESILSNENFLLHPKTKELINQGGTIDKPFTPLGHISIQKMLDENKEIDEVELQNTIDAAVRLLDNILEILSGDDSSLKVMRDYRKIALGITDFEQYIATSDDETAAIDTIGNLISNGTYRASESLAEEKGVCRMWDTIKLNLRPKTFEYWYHTDSGKIIDAHTLSQEYNQDSIKDSGYEIIPRRNSHLLSYPSDESWSIWADRSPISSESNQLTEQTDSETKLHVPSEESSPSDTDKVDSQTTNQAKEDNVETSASPLLNLDPTKPNLNEDDSTDDSSSRIENEVEPNDSESDGESETKVIIDSPESSTQQSFQIGELVVITDRNSPFYQITAQVIDHTEVSGTSLFTLKSNNNTINNARWRENQLSSVDLFELLDRINISSTEEKAKTQIDIQLLILHPDTENVLVIQDGDKRTLPEFELPHNAIPEQVIPSLFSKKFNTDIKLTGEIGSAIEFAQKNKPYRVILAFRGELTSSTLPDQAIWISFRDAQFSISPSTRVICNKYNRLKMQQTSNTPIQQTSNDTTQHMNPQTSTIIQDNQQYSNNSNNQSMSQYILKLENIVQSKVFGHVTINFKFENNKPYLMGIKADTLNQELSFFADVVMHFANHLISLNQQPFDVAQFITKASKENSEIKMNDLLLLIADSLKNVPTKPEQLSSTIFK